MRVAVKNKWTKNSRVHRIGHRKFTLDSSVGQINYHDGVEYHEIDTTPVIDDDGTHRWLIDKAPYKVRVSRRGRRRIWPDRNRPGKYITIGVPTFLDSDGDIQGRGWQWRKGDVEVRMDFGNTQVSFDIILHSDQGISEVTFPFVRNNISKASARKLLRLVLFDALGEERPISAVIRDNEVTLSWDATGMTHPITVDPTIDVESGATNDNRYHFDDHTTNTNLLFFGDTTGCYARYPGITIPQGSTIDVAYQTFWASGTNVVETCNVTQIGYLVADAPGLADDAAWHTGIDTNPTIAQDDWDAVVGFINNTSYNSATCKNVVEELVGQGGFSSGNAIGLFTVENGSDSGAFRRTDAYDQGAGPPGDVPPAIHIEYTEAAAGPDAPGNPAAQAREEAITLSWDDVIGTGTVTYNLYWALTTGVTQETGTKITGVTSPHDDGGLIVGQEYFYVVTAVDDNGESVDSAEVSATVLAQNIFLISMKTLVEPRLSADLASGQIMEPTINKIVPVIGGIFKPSQD